MTRTTGSWIVKQQSPQGRVDYLIGGPFAPNTIRTWLSWSTDAADAYVFPTKTAARAAVSGRGPVVIERA